MNKIADTSKSSRRRTKLGAAIAALVCLGLLAAAAPAPAAVFDLSGYFAPKDPTKKPPPSPEEVQLGGVGGMAVNYTGNGGVPAGTVYVATKTLTGSVRIAVFKPVAGKDPEDDGSLRFSLGWEVTVVEKAYERCGPDLLPTATECPTRVDSERGRIDVDVDQSTGDVYVNNAATTAGDKAIVAYDAMGSKVLSRFGEIAPSSDKTADTPEKIHGSPIPGMLAVNGAGEVYVFDVNPFDNAYHRLMKFKPKVPGDPSEYIYAGTGEDVAAGFIGEGNEPWEPVVDAGGNIYVAPEETRIEKYAAGAKPSDPPVCAYDHEKGGITAITVDPLSGAVFFFSYRKETGFAFKTIHQLSVLCNEETGEFEVTSQVEVKPERDDLWGMVFDPVRKLGPTRGIGTLYGAAPGSEPVFGKGEPGFGSLGYIFAPSAENPPEVESESVSKVTSKSAQLHAQIAPNGFVTDYVFQYMTETAFIEGGETFAGATEAPPGGATLDGSGETQSAAVTLTGLTPDTAYRYRVVATSNCSPGEPSKVCEAAGPAQGFHTFPPEGTFLPDNRAYELVSPPDKHGGQVFPADPRVRSCGLVECKPGMTYEHFPMQSAPDGNGVVYEGTAFAFGTGGTIENEYLGRRSGSGWESVNLTPSLMKRPGYRAFDPELSEGMTMQGGLAPVLSPEAPGEYENLYSQPTANPLSLTPFLKAEPPTQNTADFEIRYTGAASDLSRVFFAANDALTEETPSAPPAQGGGFNLYEWERATGQLRLVNVFPGNTESEAGAAFGPGSAHAISADGSRAFWSDKGGQVYVREDAEETREIPDAGKFLSAAVDGSRVLLGNGHLYDLEADEVIDLTAGSGGFIGLVGQSDDLSHVYFVDSAVLSGEEENSEGAKAQAGKNNLYAWSAGTTTFVATLAAADNGIAISYGGSWNEAPSNRTAQASPAGRYVAFLSRASLTGYDNVGPCEEISGTGKFNQVPCPEAFLYDSVSGELACASCNRSGAAPLGWSILRLIAGPGSLPQAHYLTDSGRLFFDSQDSLSPFDTNEGVEDVYQFEPGGVGDCKVAEGCVALISAGRDSVDSNFLAADPSGANVFFTSRDRLVAADEDEALDLYDARVGGGFAEESELPPPSCGEAACQSFPPDPPEPPPLSATLNDPGNVKLPKNCKKGQVKKKGKCVMKKSKPKNGRKSKRGSAK
jgi:hypothetical protein